MVKMCGLWSDRILIGFKGALFNVQRASRVAFDLEEGKKRN
jgi:hypothetical protein